MTDKIKAVKPLGTSMTVQRALGELKLLDSRITKKISQLETVAIKQNGKMKRVNKTEGDFIAEGSASYKSIVDLITYRGKIKSAVILSNANTTVNIGGIEMTVAEAIERKESVSYDNHLRNTMRRKFTDVKESEEFLDQRVEEQIRSERELILKSENSKDTQDRLMKAVTESLEEGRPVIVDAIDSTEDVLGYIDDKVDTFLSEVDITLTESNVVTTIFID